VTAGFRSQPSPKWMRISQKRVEAIRKRMSQPYSVNCISHERRIPYASRNIRGIGKGALERSIRTLCALFLAADDTDSVQAISAELKAALRIHIQQLRNRDSMPKSVRNLRVVKWVGTTPSIAVCSSCSRQFKVPLTRLAKKQDAEETLQMLFEAHSCGDESRRRGAERKGR
jgi:hypothetical protein